MRVFGRCHSTDRVAQKQSAWVTVNTKPDPTGQCTMDNKRNCTTLQHASVAAAVHIACWTHPCSSRHVAGQTEAKRMADEVAEVQAGYTGPSTKHVCARTLQSCCQMHSASCLHRASTGSPGKQMAGPRMHLQLHCSTWSTQTQNDPVRRPQASRQDEQNHHRRRAVVVDNT